MDIGIIGYGTVGRATHNSLPTEHTVRITDSVLGFKDDITQTEALFVCVPTPTVKGRQDLTILDSILKGLITAEYKGLVIIKSTILPSYLNLKTDLNLMVAPEFLDQNKPYFEQETHLIGVDNMYQARLYREIFSNFCDHQFRTTNRKASMMAKFIHNCYAAVKVTFFNEMKDICDSEGIDYRETVGAMLNSTDHISRCYTRMSVDGERGYGGACIPKDSVAFDNEYMSGVLKAAIEQNKKYRKEEMERVL